MERWNLIDIYSQLRITEFVVARAISRISTSRDLQLNSDHLNFMDPW